MSGSQPLPLPVPQRLRLNKFVRRLHDMLRLEKDSGIVEWRRGLLVLHSTDAFAKSILPKHFNTRNFKTFRRQVRVRQSPQCATILEGFLGFGWRTERCRHVAILSPHLCAALLPFHHPAHAAQLLRFHSRPIL